MTTQRRIYQSARPAEVGGRVEPMDPREQRALDELRRRRDAAKGIAPAEPDRAHGFRVTLAIAAALWLAIIAGVFAHFAPSDRRHDAAGGISPVSIKGT